MAGKAVELPEIFECVNADEFLERVCRGFFFVFQTLNEIVR